MIVFSSTIFLAELELSEGINISQENLVPDLKINHLQGLKYINFKLQPNQINEYKYILLNVLLNVSPFTSANKLAQNIVKNPKAFTEFARSEFEIFLKFLQEKKYKTTSIKELYERYSMSKRHQQ